jgi:hypothetical protein
MEKSSMSERDDIVAELLELWNGPTDKSWPERHELIDQLERRLREIAREKGILKPTTPAVSIRIDQAFGELPDPPAPLIDAEVEARRADPFRSYAAESGQNTD